MSIESFVYLVASGLVTSVGDSAVMTAMSINTGISQVDESAILNKKLNPIKMAMVPDEVLPDVNPELALRPLPARQFRMLQLASVAIQQISECLPENQSIPVFLSLPELLPSLSKPVVGNFIEQLVMQSGIALDPEKSRVAQIGRTGGIHAVEAARRYLEVEGNDYVLIGGVDTYWDLDLLARLDADDRLMLQGGLDGFIPGEGAAFLLLASERIRQCLPTPLVALSKPGLTQENGHRYSSEPYKGEGLSAAAAEACTNAPGIVDHVWTSMIYDSFGSKELGVMLTRNGKNIAPSARSCHPVDCIGDIGAAIGCTLIALVGVLAKSAREASRHLVCCSSELSPRAALRVDVQIN